MVYDESYNWCPRCGDPREACLCGADEDDWDDPELEDSCAFPGECLMPGEHTRSECHTVEMVEAFNAECLGDK